MRELRGVFKIESTSRYTVYTVQFKPDIVVIVDESNYIILKRKYGNELRICVDKKSLKIIRNFVGISSISFLFIKEFNIEQYKGK